MRRIKTRCTAKYDLTMQPAFYNEVIVSKRDYRLMRAVVRAAETPVRVATMADIVHASMLTGLARALDAFNAKRKP